MSSSKSKHVVIVGGGVVGLCSAYYCIHAGHRVTLLERNAPQRDGCSYGNAGIIVPSHFVPLAAPGMIMLGLKYMWNPESPFYIRPQLSWPLIHWMWNFWRACSKQQVERAAPLLRELHLRSRECYLQLESELDRRFDLRQQGLLMLCATEHGMTEEKKVAEMAARLDIPANVVDAGGAAEIDPTVAMNVVGGVHYPLDCHLSPGLLMESLQDHLVKHDCDFRWGTSVTGFATNGSALEAVTASDGHVEGDVFVLAGGSWSAGLARELGIRLPLQSGKGYSLTLPNPPQMPSVCSILTEARVAVTPMADGLRFGGTMELGGREGEISPARIRGIVGSIPRYFPEFGPADFESLEPWSGLRPCSPDGLPYLGKTERWKNLLISTGHAMMGLSLGPITGRITAALASGETPKDIELGPLAPERFS